MKTIEERLQDVYAEYASDAECASADVPAILLENWGRGGDRGYGIFQSDDTDVLHIQRIDELMVYDSDKDAAEQAEKDGIKLIHDIRIPKESVIYPLNDTCIDTPENRKQLLKELGVRRD